MKKITGIFSLFFILITLYSCGQTVCSVESKQRLDTTLQKLEKTDFSQKSINEVVVEIGNWFLNTPYVEKTLEVPGDEPLVINFLGLDCTTYLETVTTLARMAKMQKYSYDEYEQQLEFLRYRNGERDHYPSRLHYFSDWISDNESKGIIKDITKEIGGIPYKNEPSFMSKNPQYYAQLSNEKFVGEIANAENSIQARSYYYIPKESIAECEENIKPGDLIAITIDMDNLDIAHVGFSVLQQGRIHLMHASSSQKKVVISDEPLSDYLMGIKKHSGIMVCRLTEPE